MGDNSEIQSAEQAFSPAKALRPLLRWAGSKRRSIASYRNLMPVDLGLYVEPFAGSAAIFFSERPASAVISDLNSELIETYRWVRDQPKLVWTAYDSYGDDEASYYSAREEYNGLECSAQKAGIFLHLNRLCFNGIYRTNRKGQFNVPYGGLKPVPRLSVSQVEHASALLSVAHLENDDFEVAIERWARPGAFFFIDPPYFTSQKRIFREYGADHFSAGDLERLSRSLELIDRRGGKFLLSYADVAEAADLMAPWERSSINVTRHIGGFSKSRRTERELVAANYCMNRMV